MKYIKVFEQFLNESSDVKLGLVIRDSKKLQKVSEFIETKTDFTIDSVNKEFNTIFFVEKEDSIDSLEMEIEKELLKFDSNLDFSFEIED